LSDSPFKDSPLGDLLAHLQSSRAQSLFDRIEELRTRLGRLLLVMTVLIGGSFFFAQDIFLVLRGPLATALPGQKNVLHFAGPLEVMLSYMKVSFLLGATATAPIGLFQLWRYVGPALPVRQRKLVMPFFATSVVLFGGGAAFAFFVMLPVGLKWLIGFGGDQAAPVIMVDEYVNLVVLMLLGFGAAFQLPLLLILLERLGVISETMLTKHRGGILVGILVLAALITPSPDPFSQVALAGPMYILFEVAILVIRWLKKMDAASGPPAQMA